MSPARTSSTHFHPVDVSTSVPAINPLSSAGFCLSEPFSFSEFLFQLWYYKFPAAFSFSFKMCVNFKARLGDEPKKYPEFAVFSSYMGQGHVSVSDNSEIAANLPTSLTRP